MNNTDNHIDSWSMADVQKYLRGELPPAEMHRLEKLALDDPFLADALEGLQNHAFVDQDLADLRTRLETRVTPGKKPISLSIYKAAAAIILLVGLGVTARYTIFEKKVPAMAKAPVVNPIPPAGAARDTAPPAAIAEARVHRAKKAKPAARMTDSEAASSYAAGASQATARPAAASPAAADTTRRIAFAGKDERQLFAPIKSDTISNMEFRKWPAPAIVSNSDLFGQRRMGTRINLGSNRSQPPTANLLAFSGRVLDDNNRPVAGAALFFRGNANKPGTVTDRLGRFSLYLPMEDTTRHLTVAMAGYTDAQYSLNTEDRTGNTIYLRENPARLDGVVISGYGAKRKEAYAAAPSDEPEILDSLWLKAAPVMGRLQYLDYLSEGKKSLAVDSTIRGTERISFLVDAKGALSEFKIERSLSPAYDAGLIHLIEDGPPWKVLHGKKARAVVNLSFP